MHSNTVAVVLGLVALASFSRAGLAGDYGGLGGQQYDIPQQYDGADNAIYGGEYDNYHGPAQYSFEYGVNDPFTGDEKRQQETREGDQVTGHYSVKEADGTTRHVHYTADDYTGFKATVTKSGQPAYQPGQYGYQKETLSNY